MHTHRKHQENTQQKRLICQPGRELLSGAKLSSALVLNFLPLELWENKCLSFKPPSLWDFCYGIYCRLKHWAKVQSCNDVFRERWVCPWGWRQGMGGDMWEMGEQSVSFELLWMTMKEMAIWLNSNTDHGVLWVKEVKYGKMLGFFNESQS
jgi:hypothetical protein